MAPPKSVTFDVCPHLTIFLNEGVTGVHTISSERTHTVEQLSMALEDEREQAKALRKKNSSNIRDLQRQLQQSKRWDDACERKLSL